MTTADSQPVRQSNSEVLNQEVHLYDPKLDIETEAKPLKVDLLKFLSFSFWNQYLVDKPESWSAAEDYTSELLKYFVLLKKDTDAQIDAIELSGSIPLAIAAGGFNQRHLMIPRYSKNDAIKTGGNITPIVESFLEATSDDAPADADFIVRSEDERILDRIVDYFKKLDADWDNSIVNFRDKYGNQDMGFIISPVPTEPPSQIIIQIYHGPVPSATEIDTVNVSIYIADPNTPPEFIIPKPTLFARQINLGGNVYTRAYRFDISRDPPTGYSARKEKRTGGNTSQLQDMGRATLEIEEDAMERQTVTASMTKEAVDMIQNRRDIVHAAERPADELAEILLRTLFKNLERLHESYSPKLLTPWLTLQSLFDIRQRIQELVLTKDVWVSPMILKMLQVNAYLSALMGQEAAQFFLDTQLGEITIAPGMLLADWNKLLHSSAFSMQVNSQTPARVKRDDQLIMQSRNAYRLSKSMIGFESFVAAFQDILRLANGHPVQKFLDLWKHIRSAPPITVQYGLEDPKGNHLVAVPNAAARVGNTNFYVVYDGKVSHPTREEIDAYLHDLPHREIQASELQVERMRETLQEVSLRARRNIGAHINAMGHTKVQQEANKHFDDLVTVYSLLLLFPSGLTAREIGEYWYYKLRTAEDDFPIDRALFLVKLLGLISSHNREGLTMENERKPITFFSANNEGEHLEPIMDLINKPKYNRHWIPLFHRELMKAVGSKLFIVRPDMSGDETDIATRILRYISVMGIQNLRSLTSMKLEEDFKLFFEYLQTNVIDIKPQDAYYLIRLVRDTYKVSRQMAEPD